MIVLVSSIFVQATSSLQLITAMIQHVSWLLLCCLLNLVVMGDCTTMQEAKRYFEVI